MLQCRSPPSDLSGMTLSEQIGPSMKRFHKSKAVALPKPAGLVLSAVADERHGRIKGMRVERAVLQPSRSNSISSSLP